MKTRPTRWRVPFNYLERQFRNVGPYLSDLRKFLKTGDFTLGEPLRDFERRFAAACGAPYSVGVASGTDALILSMRLHGVGPGDEVITTPMTFVATVGAIVATGARPVFVDSEEGFVINPDQIENAITPRTKAILPVHFTGNLADMPRIARLARSHRLLLFEDACQAIGGTIDGRPAGSWGRTASYSLHPLKNLNVWSDGGMITTHHGNLARALHRYRNHGLADRDRVASWGVNSRLDTIQAVVGNRLIRNLSWITQRRLANARRLDEALADLAPFLRVPARRPGVKHVFHLYVVRAKRRDKLLRHLRAKGIEAKVHYPIPLHLQAAAKDLGHRSGDFPQCERDCREIITLPAHQHLSEDDLDYTVRQVRAFYAS